MADAHLRRKDVRQIIEAMLFRIHARHKQLPAALATREAEKSDSGQSRVRTQRLNCKGSMTPHHFHSSLIQYLFRGVPV